MGMWPCSSVERPTCKEEISYFCDQPGENAGFHRDCTSIGKFTINV